MTWWMYALLGAIMWGVHYPLLGRVMTVASPLTTVYITIAPLVLAFPFLYKTLSTEVGNVISADISIRISAFIMMFTGIIGTVAVYRAIGASNATVASLIEIAYPIFVALFSYAVFREVHLNWEAALGGVLIFVGTTLVIISR